MSGSGTSLWPREHGAYAELLFPLSSGLALGQPGPAAWSLAASAVGFFLLYEPVAVWYGIRGERLREELAHRAKSRAMFLALAAVVTGVFGLITAPAAARWSLSVPLVLALLLGWVVLARRQKTVAGEVLVVATLATVLIPVALAGGVERSMASAAAGVWFISLTLGTLAVHALKARSEKFKDRRWTRVTTPVLGATAAGFGLVAPSILGWPLLLGLSLVPGGVGATVISRLNIHPRELKKVGWSMVSVYFTAWVLLVGTRFWP